MPEFNIDQYKKSWQQQETVAKYNQNDILQMLNKKSRNYVKYILWISIVEFSVVLLANAFYIFTKQDEDTFGQLIEKLGVKNPQNLLANINFMYDIIKLLSIGIILFFVIKFYRSYKNIKIESNLKLLIQRIIDFKKTVNLFILINILFLIVSLGALILMILVTLYHQPLAADLSTLLGFGVGIVFGLAISVLLIWIYYRVIYGILIEKLGKNLEQLQKIEKEDTEESLHQTEL